MERIRKSFFEEQSTFPFAELLKILWPKQIALNWFWIAFQAIEKSGLTYYETELEEMKVRERLSLLVIFYYEFCHISASHESSSFTYWDEQTIMQLKKDLSAEADDLLFEVREALIKYFGSEEKVLAELWINCIEGSNNCFIRMDEKAKLFDLFCDREYNDFLHVQVRSWFVGWETGILAFHGISL
jgi:hypothetical protein